MAELIEGSETAKDSAAWKAIREKCHWYSTVLVVCEFPKVYPRGKSKGDPEDLLQLAAVVGAIGPDVIYRPYEWKGQTPKVISIARTQAALTDEERARVRLPRNKKHQLDVWDAVGIGLYHLRAKRRPRVGKP